ncbi:alpha/beta fold hydrolase [Streptomyces sp. NPDC101227]|uniref:alpha/beta fold hydrolase n=1 Tax=Streptomyces sp. NPDC101227 TaxID=3366136 RepID=UPI0038000C3D
MTAPRTGTLQVPGARLYYEVRGRGPVLVLIHGGAGDAGIFHEVVDPLAERFTVVVPDRRGHSRSPLAAPGSTPRVAEHSDDIHRLIGELSEEPALVYGSSSGAVVALDLLARHPDRVRTALAHEPPVIGLLPDAAAYRRLFADVQVTHRRQGATVAMQQFLVGVGLVEGTWEMPPLSQLPSGIRELMERLAANEPFFLEHELCEVTAYEPDTDALRKAADRLLIGVGRDSLRQMPGRTGAALAARLGLEVTELPGGHSGYVEDGGAFAARLAELLGDGGLRA